MLLHGSQPWTERPMRGRFSSLDPASLRAMIETERLTQREAAQRLGVSLSCVERSCKRLGLATQRTGPRSGAGHTGWKGGVRIVKGYRYLHRPGHPMATVQGYVAEHRLVMAEAVGRMLDPQEVVHHVDGDPLNNERANLELFATNADHLRHELMGQTPAWTPEGRARTQEGWRAWHSQRRSARDDPATP